MQLGLNKQLQPHMKSNHTSIKSKIKLVKTESSVPYTKCTYTECANKKQSPRKNSISPEM